MDADGTLTDGKIYMGNDWEVMKAFSAHDAIGVKKLKRIWYYSCNNYGTRI